MITFNAQNILMGQVARCYKSQAPPRVKSGKPLRKGFFARARRREEAALLGAERVVQACGTARAEAPVIQEVLPHSPRIFRGPIGKETRAATQAEASSPLAPPSPLPGSGASSWNPPEGHPVPALPRAPVSFSASEPEPGRGTSPRPAPPGLWPGPQPCPSLAPPLAPTPPLGLGPVPPMAPAWSLAGPARPRSASPPASARSRAQRACTRASSS